MPKPSPRKMGKVRDISDSPERVGLYADGRGSRAIGDRGQATNHSIMESNDRNISTHQ